MFNAYFNDDADNFEESHYFKTIVGITIFMHLPVLIRLAAHIDNPLC
jgi:hypothetical protein